MKTRLSHIVSCVVAVAAITFSLAVSSQAQTQKVLHTFTGNWDGSYPQGSLIFDAAGNLYGTTNAGGGVPSCPGEGEIGCGVVFELSPTGTGAWKETALFRFASEATGASPQGSLLFNAAGDLYGLTPVGGGNPNCGGAVQGCGIAYELSPNPSGGAWQQSILEIFNEGPEGAVPQAGFIADAAGNLYSTSAITNFGSGVVFELSPTSTGWQLTPLYSFTGGADGGDPDGNLVFDAAGNLYGVTVSGGNLTNCSGGCGVVYKVSRSSSGTWTETVLHTFSGGRDGAQPFSTLIFDAAGNLYGTTASGGSTACSGGCGVVFKLSATGTGAWKETVLHSFTGGGDGDSPTAGVIMDAAGNLYGTATAGGNLGSCNPYGCGTVFKLSQDSNGSWTETVLHRFSGGRDGAVPLSGLVSDAAGNLYGSTYYGGENGLGVIFETTP